MLSLQVFKNHYKKIISVGSSKQRREAFFWIHFKKTWLDIILILLVALHFQIFIFLLVIKLFIWRPVLLFGILISLEQLNNFVWSFRHVVFLNTRSYVFINTWNTEFYIQLLHRENKSRYKIWHSLELAGSCKWKQSTNKEV